MVQEIKEYQKKWLKHLQRMDTNRMPRQTREIQTGRKKERGTAEEEMEEPTPL